MSAFHEFGSSLICLSILKVNKLTIVFAASCLLNGEKRKSLLTGKRESKSREGRKEGKRQL